MATDQQRLTYIKSASSTYNIPSAVLIAIAIVESHFGQNEGPSSTGALGFMQIEPGTAKGLGVNPLNDQQAITGAARLLNQYGYQKDPNLAIAKYNAGPAHPAAGAGYAATVQKLAKQLDNGTFTGFNGANLSKASGLVGAADSSIGGLLPSQQVASGASAAANSASAVGDFLGKLGQASTWLSVAQVIAGAVLIIMGLRQLATVAGQAS